MPAAPRTTITAPPWWPDYGPHSKQALALWGYERVPDLCYGGSAGGGKTDYLLMAASQFCAYPGYAALIIRKTYQDLALPGAIMDRAINWWKGRFGIEWNGSLHRFTWPSGALIEFGHLQSSLDHLRYQGAELDFVGFDEATQIPGNQLTYLHSRLRQEPDSEIPIRFRLASNPGGVSHDFIRDEYVQGADGKTRVYLPALLSENPGINQEEYRERLARLDPITRRQLEDGDWDVQLTGGFFEAEKIGACSIADVPANTRRYRAWDLAATPLTPGSDPDWTVGLLMAKVGDEFWVLDMQRVRAGPGDVEKLVARTAQADGRGTTVCIEQEPGSAGVMVRRHMANLLAGFDYRAMKPTASKATRARPFASAVSNGLVRWATQAEGLKEAQAELRAFSEDKTKYAHDDIVDAASMAHETITEGQWSVVIP